MVPNSLYNYAQLRYGPSNRPQSDMEKKTDITWKPGAIEMSRVEDLAFSDNTPIVQNQMEMDMQKQLDAGHIMFRKKVK